MKNPNSAVAANARAFVTKLIVAILLVFVFVALFLFPLTLKAQTSNLTFTAIPGTDPDMNRPGGGAEQWNDRNDVNVPAEGTNTQRLDMYWRFNWAGLETGLGVYNWTNFDEHINEAISKGQKFGFGVMTCYPDGGGATGVISFDNGVASYPEYVHRLMQAEGVKDWKTNGSGATTGSGTWVPNWNSESYLTRLAAFNTAMNAHIETGTYNGVKYKDVINYVDIRGYGAWGEWHSALIVDNVSQYPAGTKATTASLKRIIDGYVKGFPNLPLVIMVSTFDGNWLSNTATAPEVGVYALQQKNNWGLLGWRRDNWGATDDYIHYYTELNPSVFNGVRMDTAIMNRYKYAPIVGEPPGWGADANGCAYGDLLTQVLRYHAASFGNGNYGISPTACMKDAVRAASKAAGYRIVLTGGNIPTTINTGTSFSAMLTWQNVGLTPTYEKWNVVYELRNSSDLAVWSSTSGFSLKLFQTGAATSYTDNLTIPTTIAAGNYTLKLIIKDPAGFRKPFPLAIKNRNADGSYTLKTVTLTTGTAPANIAPVANAGVNQSITLPTNSITLNGTASTDADGTIASYLWEQLSGPAASTISSATVSSPAVSNLVAGTYSFKLTVTDNKGATNSSTVSITVNAAANIAPVANAGANQTIILPTNNVTLNGAASSDADGTIAAYLWQQVSGPSTSVIVNAAGTTSVVNSLVAGTYSFKLTVTDNKGATSSANVSVVVNAAANIAPVANAGVNQTITLPVNTVTLNGAASTDPDGNIAAYLWQQVSGPSISVIAISIASTPTVSSFVAGTYVYKLTVTDNNGATNSANVSVIVNGAPNVAPIANAGAYQTITLPVNTISLNGTASSDADGTIATYLWQQISGPAASTIVTANAPISVVNALVEGAYTFKLTVTDNSGASNTANVSLTVNAAVNLAPIANAGTNQLITLPINSVTLSGTTSSDPDGTLVSYLWEQVSGPSAAIVASASASSSLVSSLVAGTYNFKLTVTDNKGATNSANVSIAVNAATNLIPVANAGTNQLITLPVSTITLNGTASSDADGTIASYLWEQSSGPSASAIVSIGSATSVVLNLVPGTYTYTLTITDNQGATASADVTITVNPAINIPPVAIAGAAQTITLPVSIATLSGAASTDADGTIASYQWEQVGGPSGATIASASTSTATVSNLVAGAYNFKLTVTDNNGASSSANVSVAVNTPTNISPVANAGTAQTITLPVNSATLNGSTSSDADGTIATYAWTQVSGPSATTIATAGAASSAVNNLVAGTYNFKLTVTDNIGATASANVSVTVNAAANILPVANAGAAQTITLPVNTVTLNGAASSDADGTISAYRWEQVSGPSAATIVSATSASSVVNKLVAGTYIFKLTVTDNSGAKASINVSVLVNTAANIPPVANAGTNQLITLPVSTTNLSGAASTDADGVITAYQWQQSSGPSASTLSSTTTSNTVITKLVVGSYTFKLTVTDNKGASTSANIVVTVKAAANAAPIANAGTNQTITLPITTVTLNGTGSSDPDGTIGSYLWQQVSGPSTSAINSPAAVSSTVANLVSGTYSFRLTVTDNSGATAQATVTIIVNPAITQAPANQAPVANAGADKALTLPTNSVSLSGVASTDADGKIAGYLWQQVSGPSASTMSATKTVDISVSNLVVGTYVYKLTVTDDKGATASINISVVVKDKPAAPNKYPVSNAGTALVIYLPMDSIILNGNKSYDPDGVLAAYIWEQVSGPATAKFSSTSKAIVTAGQLKTAGDYVFKLSVQDNLGLWDGSTVKITVKADTTSAPTGSPDSSTIVLNAFPNPAQGLVTVTLNTPSADKVVVNVYNMVGRRVINKMEFTKAPGTSTTSVDMTSLKAGSYIIEATIAKKARKTIKVTKF